MFWMKKPPKPNFWMKKSPEQSQQEWAEAGRKGRQEIKDKTDNPLSHKDSGTPPKRDDNDYDTVSRSRTPWSLKPKAP